MSLIHPLAKHPALTMEHRPTAHWHEDKEYYDALKLGVGLRHILRLDERAVYQMVSGSTVVYYTSPHGQQLEPGWSIRLVLAPDGSHRSLGPVGIDPRDRAQPTKPQFILSEGHVVQELCDDGNYRMIARVAKRSDDDKIGERLVDALNSAGVSLLA